MVDYDEAMLQFCTQLPKFELHAHLNGSIRDVTIRCGSARVTICAFFHYEASRTLNLVLYNWTECEGGLVCLFSRRLCQTLHQVDSVLMALQGAGKR